MAQTVEHLPSNYEALSSNSTTTKKKKKSPMEGLLEGQLLLGLHT
jgi:hypothetical protein